RAFTLALYLKSGALPADIKILESMTVSPTLGAESLKMSLWAGFIGLGIVIIFMMWYYRVPGLLADIALIFYTLVVLASMVVGNFVLSLPGIAGFILSIGMAVDANVLIFERIKEELWSGKSLRSAVETGFKRAFSSIFDSHVTTLIGAGVIYQFGSSSVKGFGLTLMLGTILSLVTAVFVTRVLVDLVVSSNLITNKKLYGE
ncbi:MAG: SecD/SecF family protein translocase subunit, partial [Firmicutes bacterium]|nr:SecD/SecF family protein translocase subunit [Bacillota bacterium]